MLAYSDNINCAQKGLNVFMEFVIIAWSYRYLQYINIREMLPTRSKLLQIQANKNTEMVIMFLQDQLKGEHSHILHKFT